MAKQINSFYIDDYFIGKTIDFCSVQNILQLEPHLNTSISKLVDVINCDSNYFEFKIKKKNGGFRSIDSPSVELKSMQRLFANYLNVYYFAIKPVCSYGFLLNLKGYSYNIVSNAQQHIGKRHLLNIDLKDFFHSINSTRVHHFFVNTMKFDRDVATILTALSCFRGRLPMGAPTSPVISNLICLQLDGKLMELSQKYNLIYTRYADDLTFSGNNLDDSIKNAINEVIIAEGFLLNLKKIRFQSDKSRQVVTGIKVNTKTNIDRRYVRNLRAIFHNITHMGIGFCSEVYALKNNYSKADKISYLLSSLNGKINFIGQVKGKTDPVYLKYKEILDKLIISIR